MFRFRGNWNESGLGIRKLEKILDGKIWTRITKVRNKKDVEAIRKDKLKIKGVREILFKLWVKIEQTRECFEKQNG